MVDAQVEPALARHLALPVAAGVVVDQLLLLRHAEQLAELSDGLLELVCVVIFFKFLVLVVLRYDALRGAKQEDEDDDDDEEDIRGVCACMCVGVHASVGGI